jgi:hypothetical protein
MSMTQSGNVAKYRKFNGKIFEHYGGATNKVDLGKIQRRAQADSPGTPIKTVTYAHGYAVYRKK